MTSYLVMMDDVIMTLTHMLHSMLYSVRCLGPLASSLLIRLIHTLNGIHFTTGYGPVAHSTATILYPISV